MFRPLVRSFNMNDSLFRCEKAFQMNLQIRMLVHGSDFISFLWMADGFDNIFHYSLLA